MRKGFKIFLGAIFVLALVIHLLIMPIVNLTDKENTHTVTINGAGELIVVEHSINGLIPMGKDYYYIGINEENAEAYTIKAPKKWLEKNFNSEHTALTAGGLEITALAKKLDYKVEQEVYSTLTSVVGITYPISASYYLDTGYVANCITRLALFAVLLFLVISFLVILKKGTPSVFSKILAIIALVWLIVMLIVTV